MAHLSLTVVGTAFCPKYACGGFLESNYLMDTHMQITPFLGAQHKIDMTLLALIDSTREAMQKKERERGGEARSRPLTAQEKAVTYYGECMDVDSIREHSLVALLEIYDHLDSLLSRYESSANGTAGSSSYGRQIKLRTIFDAMEMLHANQIQTVFSYGVAPGASIPFRFPRRPSHPRFPKISHPRFPARSHHPSCCSNPTTCMRTLTHALLPA